MDVSSNKNKRRPEQATGLKLSRKAFLRWNLMETWKDSHSEVCEHESLVTGVQVDFTRIWFGRHPPSHSEFFALEACQHHSLINGGLIFLEWDHMSLRVLGQDNLSNTLNAELSHWLFCHLINYIYLVGLPGGKRSGVRGITLAGPLCGFLRFTKIGSGRLGGCELPKIRMNHSLISEGSTCFYNKQTHKTSYF